MKILMANFPWIGGIANQIEDAFTELGHDVFQLFYDGSPPFFQRALRLHQVKYLDRWSRGKIRAKFNHSILNQAEKDHPDLFFVFNEGYVDATTVKILQSRKIATVCMIGDDPFDSFRFCELPYSLKYFDHIYVAEKMWLDKIRMVANKSKIWKILSAYDPKRFNLAKVHESTTKQINCYNYPITFSGESYGQRAEGGYRSTILSNLVNSGLKFWGDDGWKFQLKFYPELARAYSGGRLKIEELVYLYANSTINLNMPSPQLITAFQPRVFEIAACGGFQIVDYREDLFEIFKNDEIVTFKTIPEIIEKVKYFLMNPEKRKPYIKAGLKAVQGNTWEDRVAQILKNLEADK